MSYYKIAFESDAIEGLKAIQAIFSGTSSGITGAIGSGGLSESGTQVPPPQPEHWDADTSSGAMQAPPAADAETSAFSDDNSTPPAPTAIDSGSVNQDAEAATPPPPLPKEK